MTKLTGQLGRPKAATILLINFMNGTSDAIRLETNSKFNFDITIRNSIVYSIIEINENSYK
jgi:hypothetical protein